MAITRDDSLNYKLDSGIEALARGAVGATVGSIVGLGVGFAPSVAPWLGWDTAGVRETLSLSGGIWLASAIALGSIAGATLYLKKHA